MKRVILALTMLLGFQARAAVTCQISALANDYFKGVPLAETSLDRPLVFVLANGQLRTFEVNERNFASLEGQSFIELFRVDTDLGSSYHVAIGHIRKGYVQPEQLISGPVTKAKDLRVELTLQKLTVLCEEH